MKQRAHAEVIKAWAEGHQIQSRKPGTTEWKDCDDPAFIRDWEYRVKPSEPERLYPESQMSKDELLFALMPNRLLAENLRYVANAALRNAIDHGQVVTREEFDRAVGDRKARDRAVAMKVRDAAARLFPSCTQAAGNIEMLNLSALIAEVKL